MSIEAILSRADGSDEPIDLTTWKASSMKRDELLWVDATAPTKDEIATLDAALDLPEPTASILREAPGRPDVTVRRAAVDIVLQVPGERLDDEPRPMRVLVGEEWVVTVHPERIAFMEAKRDQIQDQREVGSLTPVQFLVSVLDWVVDAYFAAGDELEREVDRLDEAALRSDRDLLDRLVRMRRRIARIRRILTSHRELFAELGRPDMFVTADDPEREALRAVASRLARAEDAVGHAREMLIGTFDVHMTRTAQRTNDVMKVLTLASVILLPAVVLAGVMGMNFQVPLFDEPALFYVVVGLMVVMAIASIAVARWRNWL